jgi:muramoyltetrapeptide carboxypeptidase
MTCVFPKALKPGDRIRIVAPSGPIDPDSTKEGIARLKKRFEPVWSRESLARQGYLAGADERRRAELQAALDDDECRAVIAARGGFGVTRILDSLRFDALEKRPKWIVGSSDLTAVLAQAWAEIGLVSIHGPMLSGLGIAHEQDISALFDLLEGRPWVAPAGLRTLFPGKAVGPLIGGNLTILAHLAGAAPAGFADGALLFLEDVDERPYRLDRCLVQLARSGILDGVAGIVMGEFFNCCPGPDGVTARAAIEANLAPLGIPVVAGYPAAHGDRNYPFIHGAEVTLDASAEAASLALSNS